MEDFIDATDMEEKRLCKDLEIKNIGEYHDLYVRKDPLLLLMCWKASEKCVEKFIILSIKVSFSSWISMASSFKKD